MPEVTFQATGEAYIFSYRPAIPWGYRCYTLVPHLCGLCGTRAEGRSPAGRLSAVQWDACGHERLLRHYAVGFRPSFPRYGPPSVPERTDILKVLLELHNHLDPLNQYLEAEKAVDELHSAICAHYESAPGAASTL